MIFILFDIKSNDKEGKREELVAIKSKNDKGLNEIKKKINLELFLLLLIY